jgi:hypothetical protein
MRVSNGWRPAVVAAIAGCAVPAAATAAVETTVAARGTARATATSMARSTAVTVRQPVIRRVVRLPHGVRGVVPESCTWTREGAALLCGFDLGARGIQVGTIRPDGRRFQCLTCGSAMVGQPWRLYAFPDRRRFFTGNLPSVAANASSGANIAPQIGTCSPSLLHCRTVTIEPVVTPTIPGDLNDREPRLAPDGRHYLWTIVRTDGSLILLGDLAPAAGHYVVSNVHVLNAVPHPLAAAQWAIRGSFSEAKSFDRGRKLLFSSTRAGGLNLDVYALDLGTGRVTRLTRNKEWDEDTQFDPTDRFLILSSARRMHNQLRTTALADLPSFIDAALTATLAPGSLATDAQRRHTLEKWLTTPAQERTGGGGEMLNIKRGGWTGTATSSPWSPAGDEAAWAERGRGGATRLVVVRFPRLRRLRHPACADPAHEPACRTATPRWAPLVKDYPRLDAGTYRIAGPRGGQATLTLSPTLLGPDIGVTYAGYTTADGRILTGRVAISGYSRGGHTQTVTTAVTISGTHHGSTDSHITAYGKLVCGRDDTTLDGRHLHLNVGEWNPACGFPQPRQCPDGADLDGTLTGTCAEDRFPPPFLAPSAG